MQFDLTNIIVFSVFGVVLLYALIFSILSTIDKTTNANIFKNPRGTSNTMAVYDSNGVAAQESGISVQDRVISNVSDILGDKNFTYTTRQTRGNDRVVTTRSLVSFIENIQTEVGTLQTSYSLHNLDAKRAPTATDSIGSGYSIGSRWVDTLNNKYYVCITANLAAALWKEVSEVGQTLNDTFIEWKIFTSEWSVPTGGTALVIDTGGITYKPYYRIVGKTMELVYSFTNLNPGTKGVGLYLLKLPGGYSVDTTNIIAPSTFPDAVNNPAGGIIESIVGTCYFNHHTGATVLGEGLGVVCVYDATHLCFNSRRGSNGDWMHGDNFNFGDTALECTFNAIIPIL